VIVTLTGAEVAIKPLLAVALAVREWLPIAKLFVIENGESWSIPRKFDPSKNSTIVIVAPFTAAVAVIVKFVGLRKDALFCGVVIETVGACAGAFTMTVIGEEVVLVPFAAVARAVI
jgi:hypothetical protein